MSDELEAAEAWEEEGEEAKERATFEHGIICMNIGAALNIFIKGKNLGLVADSSVEYKFMASKGEKSQEKGKKQSRYPDVSFVRQENLPKNVRTSPEVVPDLVVEVSSPNDKEYDIEAKVEEYQEVGVKLVWVIHPYSQRIDVYRLNTGLDPESYRGDKELDGEDVLPGFKLKVSDVFNYPPPPRVIEDSGETVRNG